MKNACKFLKLFLVFCMISVFGFSQDVIILKSGDEILSKVEEVTISEIKYKKFDNLTGPLYSIEKAKVFMIKYENGSKDVFNEQEPVKPDEKVATPQPPVQQQKPQVTDVKTLVVRKADIWYNGVKISEYDVRRYMALAPGAFELYKKGNNQYFWGDFLFTASLLGDLGMILQKSKYGYISPLLALATVATFGSGITLMIMGGSNARKSVRMYDAKVKNQTSLNFNVNPNGLGLELRF